MADARVLGLQTELNNKEMELLEQKGVRLAEARKWRDVVAHRDGVIAEQEARLRRFESTTRDLQQQMGALKQLVEAEPRAGGIEAREADLLRQRLRTRDEVATRAEQRAEGLQAQLRQLQGEVGQHRETAARHRQQVEALDAARRESLDAASAAERRMLAMRDHAALSELATEQVRRLVGDASLHPTDCLARLQTLFTEYKAAAEAHQQMRVLRLELQSAQEEMAAQERQLREAAEAQRLEAERWRQRASTERSRASAAEAAVAQAHAALSENVTLRRENEELRQAAERREDHVSRLETEMLRGNGGAADVSAAQVQGESLQRELLQERRARAKATEELAELRDAVRTMQAEAAVGSDWVLPSSAGSGPGPGPGPGHASGGAATGADLDAARRLRGLASQLRLVVHEHSQGRAPPLALLLGSPPDSPSSSTSGPRSASLSAELRAALQEMDALRDGVADAAAQQIGENCAMQ